MTSSIWTQILKSLDDTFVAKGRKILLFVDNAACHKVTIPLENIRIELLPPNTTAIMQPLDQGIIHSFKMQYRKIIIRRQLFALEKGKTVVEFSKSISLFDAMQFTKSAWSAVTATTISNCFKKAGFIPNINEYSESEDEDFQIIPSSAEYVFCDDDIPCFGSLAEDEILETLMNKLICSDTEEDIVPSQDEQETIRDALLALESVHQFCDENKIDYDTITLENNISKLLVNKLGQTKITEFFTVPVP